MKVTIGDLSYLSTSNHVVRLNDDCMVKFYKLKRQSGGGNSKVSKKKSQSEFNNDKMQKILFETTFKLNNADGKKIIPAIKNENNIASTSNRQDDVKINVDVEIDKEQLLLIEQKKIENKSDPAEINIKTQDSNSDGVKDSNKGNQDNETRKPICSVRGAVFVPIRKSRPFWLKLVVLFLLISNFYLTYIIYILTINMDKDSNVICQTNRTGLETVNGLPTVASSIRFVNETNVTLPYSGI
ncbi:hypothetical protein TNIN_25471 [Trichonephila inaurata madagascariensis]|uniref:Uncharacterized protein n=1 Tax=Trichonephila inaurata madagascariensis TaxID=2747483 RepID=A0A8X7CT53_9ARAC|nr:hypothetical protein TNIN_25471 [Trichonephila inaurata madagascariensis]